MNIGAYRSLLDRRPDICKAHEKLVETLPELQNIPPYAEGCDESIEAEGRPDTDTVPGPPPEVGQRLQQRDL